MSLTLSRRAKRALAVVVIGGSLAGFAFSSAYFSSTDSTTFDTLTAGTIEISATDPGIWTGAVTNLLPGGSLTSDISVENTGTAAVAYAVSVDPSTADDGSAVGFTAGDFLDALKIDVYDDTCANIGTATRINNSVGADYLSASGVLIGDTAAYEQTSDLYLAASDTQDLCVRLTFTNTGADDQNQLQGATADLTLVFDGTQIDATGSVSH